MPLARAVVSDQAAQRTLMKMQISSTVARQIVDACLEFARAQPGGPGTYAIFVLAPNGDIVDAHVMDGVFPIGVETGLLKAKTALYARSPSSAVAQRFNNVDGRADSPRSRQGTGPRVLLRRRRPADRRREQPDRRDRCRRRQHGRAVRISGADQGARTAAAVAGATAAGRSGTRRWPGTRRRSRPSGRTGESVASRAAAGPLMECPCAPLRIVLNVRRAGRHWRSLEPTRRIPNFGPE